MKILEHLVNIKKTLKSEPENKLDLNINSMQSLIKRPDEIKILCDPPEGSFEPLNKEGVLEIVQNLIKCCENNLKEIEESKKYAIQMNNINFYNNNNNPNTSINKSIFDTTFIIQDSFLLPNEKNLGNFTHEEKELTINQNLKKINRFDVNISENFSLIDNIEENFKFIKKKLNDFKNLLEKETILKEKKLYKQEKLEKLKRSYSMMKKVYENALRRGIKIV
jgi:hypothetical protein